MKQILFITIAFILGVSIGDIWNSNTSHQKPIGQSKSVKVSNTRYFFIGYHIENETKHANGNMQWFCYDGLMPDKFEMYKFLKKGMSNLEFSINQFVIVGLYEFKNKVECDQFYNQQKSK